LVLLATTLAKLRNLDHTQLTYGDEVFHAVVAQNVLKHPLKPTLFDVPYLPYQQKNWHENHVWLHKPILPFWQIAFSFAVLGVDTFALRLPSALLSTAAAWLTYLIGKELLDRRAALLAATLQAANPALVRLVHGYQFADHVDMALLFWVEAGMYFLIRALRTGRWRDVLLAGVAQGLAFLSKSYLAAIILGVAVTARLLPRFRLGKREDCHIGLAHLLGLFGATLLIVGPWQVWCMTHFPQEFWHEHQLVWKHLNSNVEGWIAPWDRLLFDYMVFLNGVFYTAIVVAGIILLGKAWAERHTGLWLLYAWALGVVLPHLLAASKTPSATVIAMPPLLLFLGSLVSEAWKRDRWALAGLLGITVMSLIFPAVIKSPGHGYPSPRAFGGVMWEARWVIYQVAGALVIAGILGSVDLIIANPLAPGEARVRRFLAGAALAFSLAVLAWLGMTTVKAAWRVMDQNARDPTSVAVGEFARHHLPENAVLLCEEWRSNEHLSIMFYANRVCYPLRGQGLEQMAPQIVAANGIPYVLSRQRLGLLPVYASGIDGMTVYSWQPPDPPGD
jgi:4-amino-4-deoxy-L-arabinose transferase